MSAIAHYVETAGVATSAISLVREHTELIRPPRALWVSFELGRPFGLPNNVALQTRVLQAQLNLFERTEGNVILEDFPEDVPDDMQTMVGSQNNNDNLQGQFCPIPLSVAETDDRSDIALINEVRQEIISLTPWHHLNLEQNHGRSIGGVSGLSIDDIIGFIEALFKHEIPSPAPQQTLAQTLQFAASDLRIWYLDSVAAQPGGKGSSSEMSNWFWRETVAGALLRALHPICLNHADEDVRHVAQRSLVPRMQQHLL